MTKKLAQPTKFESWKIFAIVALIIAPIHLDYSVQNKIAVHYMTESNMNIMVESNVQNKIKLKIGGKMNMDNKNGNSKNNKRYGEGNSFILKLLYC